MKIKPSRAKRKALTGATDDEPTVDCSSLIDLCFLLLIYFLVTHTIAAKEQDIDMALPNGRTSVSTEMPALQVSLSAEGVVSVGKGLNKEVLDRGVTGHEARKLPLLNGRLAVFAQSAAIIGDAPMVNLNIDGNAKQQHLMDVLNALVKQKISNVRFNEFASE